MPRAFGIIGLSNSGKTTLIERLIPLLRARGLRVGTLKHDAHDFETDRPGKDTYRHREAGAEAVVIAGGQRLAAWKTLKGDETPQDLILASMPEVDLVLVEGFRALSLPKLEVLRAANSTTLKCPLEDLRLVVTDVDLETGDVPRVGLDDVEAIAEFIVTHAADLGPVTTAVLLAGGKSSRMGTDKAKLVLGDEAIGARIYRTLGEVFPERLVITNTADFPVASARCVPDRFPGDGPLEGLATAFETTHAQRVLLIACDMPFVSPELLRYMASQPDDAEALIPRTRRGREPLLAIYSRRLLPVIRERLAAGERSICGFLDGQRVREIGPEELEANDPDGRSFWNLNHPEEYREALEVQQLASHSAPPR